MQTTALLTKSQLISLHFCYTTKSEGLVLLLCGYLSFISEVLAIVRDCYIVVKVCTPLHKELL